jgi:DnaJ-class molecular chaperone
MNKAPQSKEERCIDCDSLGKYPAGHQCKSCAGTGLVGEGDGEPLYGSQEQPS